MPWAGPKSLATSLFYGFGLQEALRQPLAFKIGFCEFIYSLSFTNYKGLIAINTRPQHFQINDSPASSNWYSN